jgi:hypothetical protein
LKTEEERMDDLGHEPEFVPEEAKPELVLVGEDGNAFAILGAAQKAARRAGWPQEKITAMLDEAKSGDYDHLLQTMMEYFEVV